MAEIEQAYSIKHVAERFGVSDNTIRNWEREFQDILTIRRDPNGNRYYTESDIRKFEFIDQLRSKGFGITQIRDVLLQLKEQGMEFEEPTQPSTMTLVGQALQPRGGGTSGVPEVTAAQFQQLMDSMGRMMQHLDQRFAAIEAQLETQQAFGESLANAKERAEEDVAALQTLVQAQLQKLEESTQREEDVASLMKRLLEERKQEKVGFWQRIFQKKE